MGCSIDSAGADGPGRVCCYNRAIRWSESTSEPAQNLLREALLLPPIERAALVEQLSASLDKPDPFIDVLWLKEAESRLAAYRAGELDADDAEAVFTDLGGHV